jgi:hypothetical protein
MRQLNLRTNFHSNGGRKTEILSGAFTPSAEIEFGADGEEAGTSPGACKSKPEDLTRQQRSDRKKLQTGL